MIKFEYILNGIFYQITWFLCIFYPDRFYAFIAAFLTVGLHLSFKSEKLRELIIILIAGICGYSMDQLMDYINILNTSAKSNSSLYLAIIWFVFACTLRSSFSFIFKTYVRAISLGVLAPASYFFAQKIGVVKYSEPIIYSIAIHMFTYVSLMTFFYRMNMKIGADHE